MRRELSCLFRSRVEEVVSREMQPVEASLLANLEGLIQECQDQLSSRYRDAHMPERQPEKSPVQRTETWADPVDPKIATDRLRTIAIEKDQQSSSDFFDAVPQSLPPQEEDYFLDFSASDAELFDSHKSTPSDTISDSEYVSVLPRCNCKELCSCLTTTVGFGTGDVGICESSFVNLTRNLEGQAYSVQWQNWLETG